MLNVHISYAPDDWRTLMTLRQWLLPLEQQYFLRIWYNQPPPAAPPLPVPWNYIFFWYRPETQSSPVHPDLLEKASEAHIYLFLVSYKSLIMPWIEQMEVPAAVDRYTELGPDYVRVYPILVSPSHWRHHSRLASFKPLGTGRTLAEVKPPELGYAQVVEQLRPVIEELRRNWREKLHADGLPLDDFDRPAPPALPGRQFYSLPGWAGWLLIVVILFAVTQWYTSHCRFIPLAATPDKEFAPEYLREVPLARPVPVPAPWPPDTLK